MISYYHTFIPHAADAFAPLKSLLKGTKRTSVKPLKWMLEAEAAFTKLKTSLFHFTFLAYPLPNVRNVLTTDASSGAEGAVQQ